MAENNDQVPEIKSEAELTDAQLDAIAGGYLFYTEAGDWEAIDDKGQVVFRMLSEGFYDNMDAVKFAEAHGLSTKVLTWDALNRLRATGSI